jgi:hypothetical protein
MLAVLATWLGTSSLGKDIKAGMENASGIHDRHTEQGTAAGAETHGKLVAGGMVQGIVAGAETHGKLVAGGMVQGIVAGAETHGKLVAGGMVQAAKEVGKAAGLIAALHFFTNSFVSRMGTVPMACC